MNNSKKIFIDLDINNDGNIVRQEALAPVIISASRSTDIPRYYSDWLVNRLKQQYCVWYNPFNRKPSYISFKKTRVFVFWTKNPKPLIPLLNNFDKYGYYFQFTLNDYVKEGFEPNVGPLIERIETFRQLSKKIGAEKVIWRYDPIILGPHISPRDILMKIWKIGNELKNYTKKLVFSFVDVSSYRKVKTNMAKTQYFSDTNVLSAEPTENQIHEICEGLVKIKKRWLEEGWEISLATCAEKINLEEYGIEHNKCIDDMLLYQLFPNDKELMNFLGVRPLLGYVQNLKLKDKGQRENCGCITSKDIGSYNTCRHFCSYCYANTSTKEVERTTKNYSPDSVSIVNM